LLSEYYHDGWIESGVWVPSARQLVLVGQNSDGTWEDKGMDVSLAGKYPLVIFALRPRLGQVAEPINHPGLGLGTEPRWYRCLLPPEAYAAFFSAAGENYGLTSAVKPDKAARGVVKWQLGDVVSFGKQDGHVTLEIDADGELVGAWHTDIWNGKDKFGLSASDYTLGALPARVTDRDHEPVRSEETGGG